MAGVLILLLPLLAVVVALVAPWRRWVPWIGVVADAGVLCLGVIVAFSDVHRPPIEDVAGFVRIDSLSAFMVIVVGAVATLASWGSVRYLEHEISDGAYAPAQARQYAVLVQLFVVTMLLALVASNIGIVWVAVEATTITTTFLVGHRRTKLALEASWKYAVLCSVGIAVAFLGTVLVYLAAVHAGGHSLTALQWTWLRAHAHRLDPNIMRLAFGLLVLGYGTKVGLAPMHSWLPDAHSQAPAPVSALMSGVLLAVAFYVLLRFRVIEVLSVGTMFPRSLFVVVALLSLGVAALLLVVQRDMKRAFAYSSTEHMGLLALGAAAGGPLALAGVLLHVLGHGLTKSVLFLSSGEVVMADGTSDVYRAGGLLERRPGLGGVVAVGIAALVGLPPFSLFVSEVTMMRGEMASHLAWAVALSLVALAIAFAGFVTIGRRLLLTPPDDAASPTSTPRAALAPLVAGLVVCAGIGLLAWPLASILHAAAQVVAT